MAGRIQGFFGRDKLAVYTISTDDFKLPRSGNNGSTGKEAVDMEALIDDIQAFKNGEIVTFPKIDAETGIRSWDQVDGEEYQVLILEGTHAFLGKELQSAADLKIMIETDPLKRLQTKMRRDIPKRNYKALEVLKEFARQQLEEGAEVIGPQIPHADVIVKRNGTSATDDYYFRNANQAMTAVVFSNDQQEHAHQIRGYEYDPGRKTQKIFSVKKVKPGGIDLNPGPMDLRLRRGDGIIRFRIDPAMLRQLQNVPGFVPVVTTIRPLTDLRSWLGADDGGKMTLHPLGAGI